MQTCPNEEALDRARLAFKLPKQKTQALAGHKSHMEPSKQCSFHPLPKPL